MAASRSERRGLARSRAGWSFTRRAARASAVASTQLLNGGKTPDSVRWATWATLRSISPGLPCDPQCGAARGYVKVLALHSACASGVHAHTVCGFFYIEIGHLSAQNRHIFPLRGAEKRAAYGSLDSSHAQKGPNHVPLDNPDRGSSPQVTLLCTLLTVHSRSS